MRIGVLALVVCAGMTSYRLPAWHSDLALWEAAVSVTPSRPRPVLNLAAAVVQTGDYDRAAWLALRGLWLSESPDRQYEHAVVRTLVQQQLQWIDLWSPRCHLMPFSLAC